MNAAVEQVHTRPARRGTLARVLDFNDPRKFAALLILPAQLLLLFIVIFPALSSIYLSLTAWTPTRGGNWWEAYQHWNWLANYANVVRDTAFLQSIGRTAVVAGAAVALEFLLGLGLALLFYETFPGRQVFYTIMLLPMMVVPAVTGFIFKMIFQSNGPLNAFLSAVIPGVTVSVPWLQDPTWANVAVILADVWQWTPLMFLILSSGLVALPEDQMKAAVMLGASWWQRFRYLMLPMLKPIIVIALIIRGMEAVKIFDAIYLMTQGGPGSASESISVYMYKVGFRSLQWSYIAAAAILVLILVSVAAVYALKPLQAPGGATPTRHEKEQ